MKTLLKSIMLAAASAMTLYACTENPDVAENNIPADDSNISQAEKMIELTISIDKPETVTTRTMVAEDGVTPMWCPGDAIGVSVQVDDSYENYQFVSQIEEASKTTTFKGLTAVAETIYTYYPYTSNGVNAEGKTLADIPAVQNPAPTSFDGSADLLVGKPLPMTPETTNIEGLQFKRAGGFLKIVLKDQTGSLAGQSVKSVSVSAESNLAGSAYLDLVNGELGAICGNESKTVTAAYTSATGYHIGDENAAAFLGVYPQTLATGSTLTISAATEGYGIERTITLPYDIEIAAGQITTLTVNLKAENISENEPFLLAMSIDGAEAEQIDETTFQIKMPYGTKTTALKPQFTTNGARVELKKEQNGSKDASTVDMSSPVTFTLTSPAGLTKDYKVAICYSDLPIVYITTPSAITSKDTWTENCTIDIWNAGKQSSTYEKAQMKGRGNSTWAYKKKPYAIKLDSKAEVLGMKKHKRWVLLANYLDVTCMRNATAFEIARQLDGLAWTPSGSFVDVVMNGELIGNYYLCEQIKVDKNRVNITEIGPEDMDEYDITGGYIFELDTYYDELFKFKTQYRNLPVQFKDPDEDINDVQFNYVENYFNKVEEILYGDNIDDSDDVFNYIDIDSYVDWYLVHTLALNREPNHPKSSYMHKDRGGKLIAGPVWDFDYGTFRLETSGLTIYNAIWYDALLNNKTFVTRLKERWVANKAKLEQVETFIEKTAEQIRESAEGNQVMWPVSGSPNYDGDLPFSEAIERMQQAYRQRIENIDKAIEAL